MHDRTHLEDMHAAFDAVSKTFSALPVPDAFRRRGEAWAPIDDVRHLTLAMSATARAFALPPAVMAEKFGRPESESRSRNEIDALNRAGLAAGGRSAPSFVPESIPPEAWTPETRDAAVAEWTRAAAALEEAVGAWPVEDLDRHRFPHPFLGILTLREWIHFSELHALHHIAVARRRLEEGSGA